MDSSIRHSARTEASNKRKNPPIAGDSNNSRKNGRFEKRAKLYEARRIDAQTSDAALKDGELDLQAYLNARVFEIKALEDGIKKTKAASSTRAFQKVPRAMRRRTASHNIKKIPKRLRAKARYEQMEDNTPTVEARKRRPRTTRARIRAETAKKLGILAARKRKRQLKKAEEKEADHMVPGNTPPKPTVLSRPAMPKIRRNCLNAPPKAKSKFKKRQLNKNWLPTHLWHAKRARMTDPGNPLWRFAIPLTPSEKSYRPTHRASNRDGAVAWDTSYMSTIGIYGSFEGVERVLKALGLIQASAWGNKGQKWRAGSRKWSGPLSKERKGSRKIIGPATVLWNPEDPTEPTESGYKSRREVFVRTHPSCFLELFEELLKLVKMQSPQPYVEDLRFHIGSIDLIGPGSTEALLGVLHPYVKKPNTETKESHALLFKTLAGLTNPASLPSDALLAFSITDPRLNYPHKRIRGPDGGRDAPALETLTQWPAEEGLRPFELFSRNARFQASRLPSQKALNRRKGSNPPGKGLSTLSSDPPIPVVLMASRPPAGGQAQGTWTLLAPWHCILPIWYSLMHYPLSLGNNPRFGGLDELRQVSFEQGVPWFPADYPGTDAGSAWEIGERQKRKKSWDRRPKGKRVEWKALQLGAGRKGEIGDGLACDFELLFDLPRYEPLGERGGEEEVEEADDEMDIDDPENAKSEDDNPPAAKVEGSHPLAEVNYLPKTSFKALLGPTNLNRPPLYSLITVELHFVGRGVVDTCARIYRLPKNTLDALPSTQTEVPASAPPVLKGSLPSDLRNQWLQMLPSKTAGKPTRQLPVAPPRMPPGTDPETRKKLRERSFIETKLPYSRPPTSLTVVGGYPLCPDEEDLIGFVTTGAYNLSDGKSTAIGSISAVKTLETLRESSPKEGHLCVVRSAGEGVGWLARWEVV